MSLPPSTTRTKDNGGQEQEPPPSMSPFHYHVPGVSSPTNSSSPEESINNNSNNNNNNNNPEVEVEYQQDGFFLSFLSTLEDSFQQQPPPHQQRSLPESERHQHNKLASSSSIALGEQKETKQAAAVRMTTMTRSSPAAASSTTTRRGGGGGGGVHTPRTRGGGGGVVHTPRPSFDHGGGVVVPVLPSKTLKPLLFTPGGRGSSSSSSDDNSPAPPPAPRVMAVSSTTTTTTTLARPANYHVPTIPLAIASCSSTTTANNNNNNNNTNTASFGSDDTAPPFVFADNDDEDDDDDYHSTTSMISLPLSPPMAIRGGGGGGGGGGGASVFRLVRQKQDKHERSSSSSSSENSISHQFAAAAGILQGACVVQDSTTSASLRGLDEKQGSFADDDHSGRGEGGLLPNFDRQIHSNTNTLVKPTAYSPAGMHDETKRHEYDDDTEEEEELRSGEFVYDAGSVTNRFLRERFFTVRLSSSPVASHESIRRCSPFDLGDSRGSFNTTSATNPSHTHIIPFDTTRTTAAAGTMLAPPVLLDAEAGRAFTNLMFSLALMAAVSTSLLNNRDIPSADIVSMALAGINMFIALLTIRNASRYMNQIKGPTRICSTTAALIFISGFVVFATSIVFTVSRIIGLQLLEDVSFWVNTVANIGVMVTTPHFTRKIFDLLNLWSALSKKAGWHQSRDLRIVRYLTLAQIMLTLLALGAAIATLVALSLSAIVKGLGKITSMPFWTAMGAAAAITTTFALEHYVCYNTRCYPHPGLICELFREEIDEIFQDMSNARAASTNNNLNDNYIPRDQQQQHDQQCWEHTAEEFLHQYRFDIIFSPGRLAALLQYLHSDTIAPCNEI